MIKTLETIARILAVTLGAYGMSALIAVALSLMLARAGLDKVEVVTAATLPSFAIFAIAAMAVFHTGKVARAWGWLALISALAGAIILLTAGTAF